MSGLAVQYRDQGLCVATWGSLVVYIWSGPINADRVEVSAQTRQRALEQTDGIGSVFHVHVARRVPRPDEAVRRRAKDIIAHFAPCTIGQVHVIEADGFKASALRSLVESTRSEAPLLITSSIDDAVDWLAELDAQDPMFEIYRDKLCEDIRELTADVVASLTAA